MIDNIELLMLLKNKVQVFLAILDCLTMKQSE